MTSDPKAVFGVISVIIALITAVPYVRDVLRGETKPHAFSWVLWSMTGWITFSGQIWDDAGAGSWAMLVAALVCTFVLALSLKTGEKNITRMDWIMFSAGLVMIPAWIFSGTPLWSALLAGSIDIVAYGPTIRKTWRKPFEESASLYILAGLWELFSVLAMKNYSWITTFNVGSLCLCNLIFVPYLFIRRHQVKKHGL